MRRAALVLIVAAAGCSKAKPGADTAAAAAAAETTAGTPATAAAPVPTTATPAATGPAASRPAATTTPSTTTQSAATPTATAPAPAAQLAPGTGDTPPKNVAIAPQRAPRPTRPGARPETTLGDEIVGRVNEFGFDPETFLAIAVAGARPARVSGTQLDALGSVKGAEIWARGKREAAGFRVDTFEVRRANNQPVEDGIVSVSGTTVAVRTSRGTLIYRDAPLDLRRAAGSRVWITPPAAGQAPSFGVIRGS